MKLIGISGKSGAGKDTVGVMLGSIITGGGKSCIQLSFADILKDNLCTMYGWNRVRMSHDTAYKEGNTNDDGSPDLACELLGMTRREALQHYGTDGVRHGFHTDAWVIALEVAIASGKYEGIDVGIITDVRFFNEINMIKKYDGHMIRVNRVGNTPTLTAHTDHISEYEWTKWDQWDGTFTNITDDVQALMLPCSLFITQHAI